LGISLKHNQRYGSTSSFFKQQLLHNFTSLNPTYWPTSRKKRPDIVDIFISSIPNIFQKNILNLLDPCSDYTPIPLSLNAGAQTIPKQPSLKNGKMNWEKFRQMFGCNINLNNCLKSSDDIENIVKKTHYVNPICS